MGKWLVSFFLIIAVSKINAQKFNQTKKTSNLELEHKSNSGLPVVKLGFEYTNDFDQRIHRQIAASFKLGNSFNHENGYDSYMADVQPTDMYWQFLENGPKYVIIGVQQLRAIFHVPVVISINNSQEVKILLDKVQNISSPVFLNDFATGQQHNLENPVDIYLTEGIYSNRFSISFIENQSLSFSNFNQQNKIKILYSNLSKTLNINNPNNLSINNLQIMNMNGRLLKTSQPQNNSNSISVNEIPNGMYIVKLNTSLGNFTEKVVFY